MKPPARPRVSSAARSRRAGASGPFRYSTHQVKGVVLPCGKARCAPCCEARAHLLSVMSGGGSPATRQRVSVASAPMSASAAVANPVVSIASQFSEWCRVGGDIVSPSVGRMSPVLPEARCLGLLHTYKIYSNPRLVLSCFIQAVNVPIKHIT